MKRWGEGSRVLGLYRAGLHKLESGSHAYTLVSIALFKDLLPTATSNLQLFKQLQIYRK
jgi:hypothetical protein